MVDSFILRIPGFRPLSARLVSPGEVEVWQVSGPACATIEAQRVADSLVVVMGARGRSMRDVAILQDKYPPHPYINVHLQPRLSTEE